MSWMVALLIVGGLLVACAKLFGDGGSLGAVVGSGALCVLALAIADQYFGTGITAQLWSAR